MSLVHVHMKLESWNNALIYSWKRQGIFHTIIGICFNLYSTQAYIIVQIFLCSSRD